ncbi:MAG: hypothetical protein R2857_09255 [Vampirovibrionales bacterium]
MQLHTQYPADPFLAIQAATNAIQVERGLEAVDLLKPFLGGVSPGQSQSQYQAMAQGNDQPWPDTNGDECP